MFAVSGSQADRADRNKVTLLKLSELQKTQTSAGNKLSFWSILCFMHIIDEAPPIQPL